ncbi:MAG: hypothetical protein K7J46_03610 [Bryobacter sp.]|jgi:hypothetical protein|nr:hypothetical protein [Bryobacter sp. CoA8 C33]
MNLDSFKHCLALDALSLTSVLTPLLHQYRAGIDESLLANRIDLEMTVSRPGPVDDVWMAVPADGQYGFIKVATRVSVQLQKMLRCWLQMHWFARPGNLADRTRTAQLLAYLAAKPFFPKVKNAYGYDLLDDKSMSAMERSVRCDISDVLGRASNLMRILGEHELADYYDPAHAARFLEEVQYNSKLFFEILTRESRILHAWIPLIGRKPTERQLELARRETRTALNDLFRRGDDLAYLLPLFELEILAALEAYIGRPVSRVLTLRGNPRHEPQKIAVSRTGNVIPFPKPIPRRRRYPIIALPLTGGDRAA